MLMFKTPFLCLLAVAFLGAGVVGLHTLPVLESCDLVHSSGSCPFACNGECDDAGFECNVLSTPLPGGSTRYECRCEKWIYGLPPILDDWYWPDSECAESHATTHPTGPPTITCIDLNCPVQCDKNTSQEAGDRVCICPE